MATSPATFTTWWNAIVAGIDKVIDGQDIAFFDDNDQGKFGQGKPPAINMRFIDDAYLPPKGGRRGGAGDDPIWSCSTRIGMHIWGRDPDQVHEIRRRLIAALHDVASHGNYRLENGAWNTGTVMEKGAIYVFATIWDIPIVRNAGGTAVITQMDNDVGIGT